MDRTSAIKLNELTKTFYARYGTSFGQTRAQAWEGWERVARELEERGFAEGGREVTVLDVGAGNGRFERFLLKRLPQVTWHFTAVDFCAPETFGGGEGEGEGEGEGAALFERVVECDVIAAAIAASVADEGAGEGAVGADRDGAGAGDTSPSALFPAITADVVVAFGLMHHVPAFAARTALMRALINATNPGGLCAVSFWQFMNDARLAAKAEQATAERLAYLAAKCEPIVLDTNDYLLGWQDATPQDGAIRYAHHFTTEEIHALEQQALTSVAEPVAHWRADGRAGALNSYVLFQHT